jgi:hypothetical protein
MGIELGTWLGGGVTELGTVKFKSMGTVSGTCCLSGVESESNANSISTPESSLSRTGESTAGRGGVSGTTSGRALDDPAPVMTAERRSLDMATA